jgi:vacuolar protein 8
LVDVAQLEQDEDFCWLVRVLEDASAYNATKVNAARVLENLAWGNNANTAAFVAAGSLSPLVELLSGGWDEGRAYAARTLRNLTAENDAYKVAMVAAGAIAPLVELLSSDLDEARAGAAGALRNLTGGNDVNKAAVMAAGAIPPLVDLLRGEGSVEGKQLAVMALYNLISLDCGTAPS